MSVVERPIAITAHAPTLPHGGRQRRLNRLLAAVLVAMVALAPLPLGSNRPFFWALWAAVTGMAGGLYLLALLRRGETLRVPLRRYWLPALLFLLLLLFLVFQQLPLPWPVLIPTGSGAALAAPTTSLHPGATFLVLLQVATYGLFFFLMLQAAANRGRARTMLHALFFVVTAYAVYGLLALALFGDPLLFFEKWAYHGYATGPFVNRNSFATFLAFGLVLGVTLSFRHKLALRSPAPVYLSGIGLILAALLATGSRMGLLAGLLGAACAAAMALMKSRAGRRHRRRWLLLAALPLAGALLVAVLYGSGTLDRLGSVENDANIRGDLYAQVLSMIAANPWFGYGAGAFELAFPLFHQWPVSPDLVWDKAHSTYLSLWVEMGIVAGSVPLLLLASFALEALRLYARRSADWAAPAAAVAATVVAAVHSLVDFSLEMQANALLLLAILAIAVARPRREAGSR